MYSKELINAYMSVKKYTQYKQMAADLNFTGSYIAAVNLGQKEFTEETATYIAKEAGLDISEVLIKLSMAKAKTETTKNAWSKVLNEHQNSMKAASTLGNMQLS